MRGRRAGTLPQPGCGGFAIPLSSAAATMACWDAADAGDEGMPHGPPAPPRCRDVRADAGQIASPDAHAQARQQQPPVRELLQLPAVASRVVADSIAAACSRITRPWPATAGMARAAKCCRACILNRKGARVHLGLLPR